MNKLEAADILYEMQVTCDCGNQLTDIWNDALNLAIAELEDDGWFSVKKALPPKPKKDSDVYIVQCSHVKTPFLAYWDGENWDDKVIPLFDVIAWQPMPRQYIEDSGDF
jgi:hypothetical protein